MEDAIKPLENSLVTLPPAKRAAVVLGSEKAEAQLRELVAKSAAIKTVTDGAGREEAHRSAMNLRNARTSITKLGEAAREDATAFSRAVIAEEKRLAAITTDEEARVLKLRNDYDAKVKAEKEAAERAEYERIAAIRAKIDTYRGMPASFVSESSEVIGAKLYELSNMDLKPEEFGDFLGDAALALREAGDGLEKLRLAAVAREEEAAKIKAEREELARLRAEENERARVAKELAEQQERLAAIERERIAKLESEAREESERIAKAEADRVAAQQKLEAERLATEAATLAEAALALAAERAAIAAERERLDAAQRAADQAKIDEQAKLDEPAPVEQGVQAMSFDHGDELGNCAELFGEAGPRSSPAAGPVDRTPETPTAQPAPAESAGLEAPQSISLTALKFAVTTLLSEGHSPADIRLMVEAIFAEVGEA